MNDACSIFFVYFIKKRGVLSMDKIINILEVIADNQLIVLASFAVVAIIGYSIVAMTGRRGQSGFKEGVLWVAVALIAGLAAKELAAWIVASFG